MSKIEERASKIFNGRSEKLKELEERQKEEILEEKVEEYVEKILDVFEASNLEEESTVLIWQLYLYLDGKHLECKVSFDENQNDFNVFYYEKMLNSAASFVALRHFEKTKEAMKTLNRLEIPINMIGNIISYFNQNLSKYFIAEFKPAGIVIKLERKTNCEKTGIEK